jgi:hypothetical protein
MPPGSLTPAQRARQYKRALKDLTQAVSLAVAQLDAVMGQPESRARGELVAQIVNALDMANDSALRFGLHQSFPAIAKSKQRLAEAPALRTRYETVTPAPPSA